MENNNKYFKVIVPPALDSHMSLFEEEKKIALDDEEYVLS